MKIAKFCNRELYNQTKSEKFRKVKNYIKNPSKLAKSR
jgi:hypothetical protein